MIVGLNLEVIGIVGAAIVTTVMSAALIPLTVLLDECDNGQTKRKKTLMSPIPTGKIAAIIFTTMATIGTVVAIFATTKLTFVIGLVTLVAAAMFSATAIAFTFAVMARVRGSKHFP